MSDTSTQRIALIANGGFDGGLFDQGIPTLVELKNRIAEIHDVATYSLYENLSGRVLMRLLADHARAPYSLLHGFWGTGGGRIATLAGRVLRIPSVVTLMGGETASIEALGYGTLLDQRKLKRLKRTCARSSQVAVLSEFQRDLAAKHIDGEIEFEVIPFGINCADFSAPALNWEPPWRLLHVANQTEVKDQTTLLKAFKKIAMAHDATLKIIGPDYLDGALGQASDALGIAHLVEFAGPVPHVELPAAYADAHILLHSSLYESQAVVAVEAMASSTAICATRTGLFSDLDGSACLVSDPGDAEALANNVKRLIEDDSLARRLIGAGASWASRHDAAWTASQYLEIYAGLVSGHGTRA